MDAIKKKMQSLKSETENALARAAQLDEEAKDSTQRAEKTEEHVNIFLFNNYHWLCKYILLNNYHRFTCNLFIPDLLIIVIEASMSIVGSFLKKLNNIFIN